MRRLAFLALVLSVCAFVPMLGKPAPPTDARLSPEADSATTPPSAPRRSGVSSSPIPDPRSRVNQQAPQRPAQPARDAARPVTGAATIRGRVYAADSGAPLRRARVCWSSDATGAGASALHPDGIFTDANGGYEIRNLPPGRYRLFAKRTGYVQMDFGARRAGTSMRMVPTDAERGVMIDLADGQTFEGADFYLARSGAITGRVVDETGDPLVNAIVTTGRLDRIGGRSRFSAFGVDMTDDQGEFRLGNLPPASYYVTATAPPQMRVPGQSSAYADVLYPGVFSRDQAQLVGVQSGHDVPNISFTLTPVRLARLSGTTMTSQGTPAIGAAFNLERSNTQTGISQSASYGTAVGPDGSFSLQSIAPGDYDLYVRVDGANRATEIGMQHLSVMGEDVPGINIITGPPGQIAGIVGSEQGGARLPASASASLRVVATAPGRMDPIFGVPSPGQKLPGALNSDGSFILPVMPGRRIVDVTGLPTGWGILAVRAGDRDITETPTEFPQGTSTSVDIVLSNRLAMVQGVAVDDQNRPTWDYAIVVFPTDSSLWGSSPSCVKTARPNQVGQFRVEGLRPGKYNIIAVEGGDIADWSEKQGLERLSGLAAQVTLAIGDQKAVQLRTVKPPSISEEGSWLPDDEAVSLGTERGGPRVTDGVTPTPDSGLPTPDFKKQQGRPGAVDARPAAEGKGTAVIRGRVVAADTGRPIGRVSVSATADRIRRSAYTGPDGRFEWNDLPAGNYRVHASVVAYVGLDFREDAEHGGGQDISLRDREVFEKADFALPRGGVITGRITDEANEPVEGIQVQAFSVEYVAGLERLMPARGATVKKTNDVGRYRIFGLSPGDYYIVAGAGPFTTESSVSDMSLGYAVTFYPGVTDAATAQMMKVSAAQELTADFGLVSSRTFEVSGLVTDLSTAAVPGAWVMLTPGSNVTLAVTARATAAGDGTFRFSGIAPGRYVLQTMPAPGANIPFAAQAINVSGDVRNVVLQARPSPVIQGDVVFEGGQPSFTPSDLQISPIPVDFTRTPLIGHGFGVEMRDDWTFEMHDLWGPRLINATAPAGWGLKAVRVQGIDMTDRPIDFERENLGRLHIVLTNRITDLTGAVVGDDGQPAKQVPVIVFSSDASRWDFASRSLKLAMTDENGRYELAALPPGEYRAIALARVKSGNAWQRPQFLTTLMRDSVRVVLSEGERVNVDLKVVGQR